MFASASIVGTHCPLENIEPNLTFPFPTFGFSPTKKAAAYPQPLEKYQMTRTDVARTVTLRI